MFISFEGIDGSGKTTQIQLLKKRLENLGANVIVLREPGGTDFSEKIRELLLDKKYSLNFETELLLFESARAYLTSQVIKPALEKGTVVLTDRFYDSTVAYQGYGRGLDLDFINICNKFAVQGITPDITFYLHISWDTSLKRRAKGINDRIESSGEEFYQKVIEGFSDLSQQNSERVISISAEQEKEIIAEEIFTYVLAKLDITQNITQNKIT